MDQTFVSQFFSFLSQTEHELDMVDNSNDLNAYAEKYEAEAKIARGLVMDENNISLQLLEELKDREAKANQGE